MSGKPERRRRLIRRIAVVAAICTALVFALAAFLVWTVIRLEATYVGVVRSDLRAQARALEEFRTAHGSYPKQVPLVKFTTLYGTLRESAGESLFAVEPGSADVPGLTTPVAYATSLFLDRMSPLAAPFAQNPPFAYWTNGSVYILYSAGPDWRYDIQPLRHLTGITSTTNLKEQLTDLSYDPTNGNSSSGDIWHAPIPELQETLK